MDFRTIGVVGLADMIRAGDVSASEVVGASLERIEASRGLGAFVAVDGDAAMAQASDVDTAIANGEELGPLAGVPIGVKDLEDACGFVTTHGSVLHRHDPAAQGDSILVDRLRSAGCIVVGKTNTPEFGWKGDTQNELFGATANPWDQRFSAGGSSGGSASAVAGGLVPLATASDGGGSIRIPASVCGLSGFKPSMGRIPIGGVEPPGWPDLSVKGVLTTSLRDTVAVLDSVVGPDPTDRTSLPMPDVAWLDGLDALHLPRRVVWSPNLGYANVDAEIATACAAAVDKLADAGVEVVQVDHVFDEDPVSSFLVLSGAANLRVMRGFKGHPDWDRVDPMLRGVMDFAERLSATDYLDHCDVGHRLNWRLIEVLHRGSVLLCPTVAGLAGPPGGVGTINGVGNDNWVQLTYPFNLTRSPAGSIPIGLDSRGVPIGLQVIGPQHGDMVVLRAMAAFEEVIAFDQWPAIAP